MPALTVFLAPDGPADGVLDVLVDLSAAGLVDPFLWVRESQVASAAAIDATAVGGGLRRPVTLADTLLDQPHDRVRLCVVVPMAGGAAAVPYPVEQRMVQTLTHNGTAPVTRIRCLIARPGSTAPDTDVTRLGWHNVLIAFEEAYGPTGRLRELSPATDPVDVGRHAAPTVAGVLGLWSGVEGCPLDVPTHEGLRAVRAFYRRIDAGAVEHELRERVLATGPELPLPRGWGDPVIYLDNPAEACRDMAERLWTRHRDKLVGPREEPRYENQVALNWRTALGWLLRFIGAALRNWPADWLRGERNRAAVKNAQRVQRAVLGGGDSAYAVVVRGMTPENVPAGWQEFGAASASIDERLLAEGLSSYQPPAELTEMWADYRSGAFSLVDAGDRQGMPPRQLSDGRRAILRFADDCVPAPDRRFTAVPGQVAARVGLGSVAVGDVLGARLLRDRLEHLGRVEPMQAMAAGGAVGELTDWVNTHDRSYSAQVGGRIAQSLVHTVAQLGDYLRVLDRAPDADTGDTGGSRAVTLWLRVLAGLAGLGIIAGPALRLMGVVNTRLAVIIAVAPVLLWLGVVVGVFANQQRHLFQELNRRARALSEIEAAQVNLRQAVIDVRRLQDAYEQYLIWSAIVGALLARPYGPPAPAQAGLPRIARGLPRTTRVAQALTDVREISAVAEILRTDQYDVGWFGNLWDLHQRDAVGRLGLHQLVDRPGDIIQMQGRKVQDTPLAAWAALLEREGNTRRVGDAAWSARLSSLDGPRRDLARRLLSSVRVVQDGDEGPLSLEEFLAALDRPDRVGRGLDFAAAHFTEQAQTEKWTGVAEPFPRQSRVGLSRVATLVQLGMVLAPWHFAVTATAPSEVPREVPLPPTFPDEPALWGRAAGHSPAVPPRSGGSVPPAPDGFA